MSPFSLHYLLIIVYITDSENISVKKAARQHEAGKPPLGQCHGKRDADSYVTRECRLPAFYTQKVGKGPATRSQRPVPSTIEQIAARMTSPTTPRDTQENRQ